jgi:acyl-CoA synthetase (AMP-forming)/AMP-acid ligase II
MLLTEILPRSVLSYPKKLAVACGETRLTYAEIGARVGALTGALRSFGINPGDRVGLLHKNCHRVLETYFAAVHTGAVLVPLNYRLTARDLAFIIDDTKTRLIIADTEFADLASAAAHQSQTGCRIIWSRDESAGAVNVAGDDYEAVLSHFTSQGLPVPCASENDPANLYYTSGTTGRQKGVILTHKNIYSHALGTMADLKLHDADVWAHIAPMFHLADAWAIWAITWIGARHVMIGKFAAPGVLRAFVEQAITVTNLIPTMLNDLVHCPDAEAYDYPSLRLLMSGGAPISPSLVQRLVNTFHCEYVQTYGLTETSPYLTFSLLKEHLKSLSEEEQMRYRSMTGRAALGVELRVVDESNGDVPADGRAVGEIIARGDRVTPGYWKLPEATSDAFRDGWFRTGDLATIDSEGYVNIVDRKKDAIVTGGEVVYSTEVENALYEHPAVLEAAVISVPDERWGEAIKAVVVLKPGQRTTAEELIAHCQERLARFKCPRSVEFIAALPRTGSGKIAKKEIRDSYWTGQAKRVH